VRFIELELEASTDLPPSRDIQSMASPGGRLVLLDRPDGAMPRLRRFDGAWSDIALEGFLPRMLADSPDGGILAIGTGDNHSGALYGPSGGIVRRFRFGDGVTDVSFDPDGNIFVLRREAPLLLRFDPQGDRVLDDPAVEDIHDATQQKEGWMLLVQNDGAIWLNLSEKYDSDGKRLFSIDPAELFGPGRVAADVLGWDAILVLNETGAFTAVRKDGRHRSVRLPEAAIRRELGRPLTASFDLFTTKEERLTLVATDRNKALTFRILSE